MSPYHYPLSLWPLCCLQVGIPSSVFAYGVITTVGYALLLLVGF